MSDEERIELQMVDRYQERLTEARRLKMWQDAEQLREERARAALRRVEWQPTAPEYGWLDAVMLLVFVLLLGAVIGGTAIWLHFSN